MSDRPTDADPPIEPERWDALARYLAGESAPDEAERMRRWLEAEPGRAELVAAMDRSLARLAFQPPADLDVEAALDRVTARLQEAEVHVFPAPHPREQARPAWTTIALRVAAVLVLLLGGVFVWRTAVDRNQQAASAVATLETRVGQIDSVRLADGTRVVLGPDSRLTVAAAYGEDSREVELSGEALFDVPHDETRPFTVRAGSAVIRDLGTTFSVRNEPGEDVRVVVTSGSVLLHSATAAAGDGVTLAAGERGVLRQDGSVAAEAAGAAEEELAWASGQLVFLDAPLSRVSADLRRWYGVELRAADPALGDRRLTATFRGESRQQVLDIIALALGATVELRGDTAFLRPAALDGAAR
jgi:transmembrane sensor